MQSWDYVVDKENLRDAAVVPAESADAIVLGDGDVLLAIERFAMTANNITYGKIGDRFGYWRFFPAPEGKGRIPAWGAATVARSNASGVAVGQRVFGYLPMSTHLVAKLEPRGNGFVDTAAHRAQLPPTYNFYEALGASDGFDDYRSLLRPLLMTSFLLDDFLGEATPDMRAVILSSASSKTAMGLAWALRKRGGVRVFGLSSPANAKALAALNLYDQVFTYADVASIPTEGPAIYVDFAGDAAITGAVHTRLGDSLARSLIVGGTHWEARGFPAGLPGPTPELFFAPDRIRQRARDWGPDGLQQRFGTALKDFVAESPWLEIITHRGATGMDAGYRAVLEGEARPTQGVIIIP